jgi:hypothetical protein
VCRKTYSTEDSEKHYGPKCPHRSQQVSGLPEGFFEDCPLWYYD